MLAAMNRPDWVHCIRHTHADMLGKVWCGGEPSGWDFISADHAAENGRQLGRLVACRKCVAAIHEALVHGHDDAEYPKAPGADDVVLTDVTYYR